MSVYKRQIYAYKHSAVNKCLHSNTQCSIDGAGTAIKSSTSTLGVTTVSG